MAAPRKYDEPARQRAVGMYRERLAEGNSKLGARKHVRALLDIDTATLRNWVDIAGSGGFVTIVGHRRAAADDLLIKNRKAGNRGAHILDAETQRVCRVSPAPERY